MEGDSDSDRIAHLQEKVSHLLLELRDRNAERAAWVTERRGLVERNLELQARVEAAEGSVALSPVEDTESEALLATLQSRLLESRRPPPAAAAAPNGASGGQPPRVTTRAGAVVGAGGVAEPDVLTEEVIHLLQRAEVAAMERDEAVRCLDVERQALSDAVQQLAVSQGELRTARRALHDAEHQVGMLSVVQGLKIELQDGKYREQVMSEEAEDMRKALAEAQEQANYSREEAEDSKKALAEAQEQANYSREEAEGLRRALAQAQDRAALCESKCEGLAIDARMHKDQKDALDRKAQALKDALKALQRSPTPPGAPSPEQAFGSREQDKGGGELSSILAGLEEERSRADEMVESLGDVKGIVRTISLEFASLSNFAKRLSTILDPHQGGAERIDCDKAQTEARALDASCRSLQTLVDEIRVGIDFVVHLGQGQRVGNVHGSARRT